MMNNRLIATAALLLAGFSPQFESQANAGSFTAGRPERSMTLSRTQRSPATYRPGSYRPAAYGSTAYGSNRGLQPKQPTVRTVLGPNHGRRLTPAQSRALLNNPQFRRCGVDVSCTTRIVSGQLASAAAQVNDLGNMLAREQIRQAIALQPLSPLAPTPALRQTRGSPAADLGDMLAREEIRGIIQLLGY